jgi:GDP-L-fucose synthase
MSTSTPTSFWTTRRVLVTGAGGFVGGYVRRLLDSRGVAEIAAPRSRDCDLTDPAAATDLVASFRPQIILHVAGASGGIGAHAANHAGDFRDNMMMGLNLIEAARLHGVEGFVQVGSADAYSPAAPIPFREEDLWSGPPHPAHGPYAIAKRALHTMVEAYYHQYELPAAFALIGNIYGPGSTFDLEKSQVVAAMIRKFCDAADRGLDTVECWGTGNATRDFLFVEDAAAGIVAAGEHCGEPQALNMGGGAEVPVRELASTIAELVGYQGEIFWNADKPEGPPRRFLDISRARREVGFEPKMPFSEGLKLTIDWWRNVGSAQNKESNG